MNRDTVFSPDRVYRYTLWREWPLDTMLFNGPNGAQQSGRPGEFVQFIGLNPSTADETKDDPTIRRCIGFARRWGYSALCMTNLFAFRSTDPKGLPPLWEDRAGPHNLRWVMDTAASAGLVVSAWGSTLPDAVIGPALARLRIKLWCLGKTSDGSPRHPLYVRADKELEEYP